MVLSQSEIEDIKSECFANDVVYNYDVLKNWDEDKVRDYFESGGGGEGAAPSSVFPDHGDDPFKVDMPKEVQWRMNPENTVAVITLNRPEAKNAMDGPLTIGLQLSIQRVKAMPSLRVVFLTGNGAMFCAGGDPKGFQEAQQQGKSGGEGNNKSANAFAEMLDELNLLPVSVRNLLCGVCCTMRLE